MVRAGRRQRQMARPLLSVANAVGQASVQLASELIRGVGNQRGGDQGMTEADVFAVHADHGGIDGTRQDLWVIWRSDRLCRTGEQRRDRQCLNGWPWQSGQPAMNQIVQIIGQRQWGACRWLALLLQRTADFEGKEWIPTGRLVQAPDGGRPEVCAEMSSQNSVKG